MNTEELFQEVLSLFPTDLQEEWDNSGIQVFSGNERVTRVLLSLDCSMDTVSEAVEEQCQAVITHHPLIFKPVSTVDARRFPGNIITELVKNNISLLSLHTSLDRQYHDTLCRELGMESCSILYPVRNRDDRGYGSLATLEKSITLKTFLERVKKVLGLESLSFSGDLETPIETAALLNGAGSSKIQHIIESFDPHCIITGDVTYHSMKFAHDAGTPVIDAGHFGTETILLKRFQREMEEYLTERESQNSIDFLQSKHSTNPYKVYR
jgi:dinuclear metal center YbgI/SA1388 family protein